MIQGFAFRSKATVEELVEQDDKRLLARVTSSYRGGPDLTVNPTRDTFQRATFGASGELIKNQVMLGIYQSC